MPLTKSELVDELVERGAGERRHVRNMLDHLADIGVSELRKGEDFTVPGLVKLHWGFRKPQKKGDRWKKGDTVTGFGGIESVKEEDSPPVKAQAKLKASVIGLAGKLKPGSKPEAQSEFLKSPTGKAVVRRKG